MDDSDKFQIEDNSYLYGEVRRGTESERNTFRALILVVVFFLKLNGGHIGICYTIPILLYTSEVLCNNNYKCTSSLNCI